MSDELKTLYPQKTLTCGHVTATIRPLSIRQIPDAAQDLTEIGERLIGLITQLQAAAPPDGTGGLSAAAVMGVIAGGGWGNALGPALAAAVRCMELTVTPALDQIPAEHFPELLGEFMQLNFSPAQLAKWATLGERIKALLAKTPSN